ncbi:unnamed protein product, partial [marine sediment metagenome]
MPKEQNYKEIRLTRIMKEKKEKEEISDIIVRESFLSIILNEEKLI